MPPASLAEKVNAALVEATVPSGPESIMVSGGVDSMIVHVLLAGVSSMFPATSIARTSKLCSPIERSWYSIGEVHLRQSAPSSEHSKVDSGSLDENVNVAVVLTRRSDRVAGPL